MSVYYSVIIPLKNEEGNIRELIEEIEPVMASLGAPWEMICVEDGSTDSTLSVLQDLGSKKPYLRILVFAKNYGQSSAFDAGFKAAIGDFVITMDGDRQNDPADIPKLVDAMEHHDLVCGIRKKRKDTAAKRITSRIANAVRRRVCRDGITDTGCSLKVYRRACLQKIKMYHGMHRFLPALFQIEGFRVGELDVNHRVRTSGQTKYSFWNRFFNSICDMLAVRWMHNRQLRYVIKRKLP